MIRLALTLTRAGGWPRMLLLGSCTAVVCALLLVVATYARLPAYPEESLFELLVDSSSRAGTAFATALLTLPPLMLLHQAVRLGTSARDRRLAALRLAGATPAEVRRLGSLEVGIPAFVGSFGGIVLYWVLRQILGSDNLSYVESDPGGYEYAQSLKLLPTSVSPHWWDAALIVVATTLIGVFVGGRAARGVIVTPLGVSRRQAPAPPRPWGLLLVLGALLLVPVAMGDSASDVTTVAIVALAVLGMISLAPWAAHRAGTYAASRTTSAALLLAARRLVADPRPAGRAAAAVGAIGLVSGGGAAIAADLVAMENVDPFYYISVALVGGALVVALLVAIGTLGVHSVESLLDRKRSIASLVALGAPLEMLESARRWEARLVALPMATVGVLLGSLTMVAVDVQVSPSAVLIVGANVALTLGLVWLAITAAVRITRPWAVRAASASNLRTE